MIGLPAGTRIWIAAGVTDLRRGFTGLSGMVQTTLKENPFSGHVFVFRGRRGDLIKMLWWDGDGLCLFAKRIERGKSMLLEGIDWRRPVRSYDPQMAV
jgi:transposase